MVCVWAGVASDNRAAPVNSSWACAIAPLVRKSSVHSTESSVTGQEHRGFAANACGSGISRAMPGGLERDQIRVVPTTSRQRWIRDDRMAFLLY